jgi:putative ABC transport system permease protein
MDVVKMILKQAAWMGVTGVALGFLLSFGGGRALTAQGMPAFDPLLFSLAPVALLLTTLLAAAVPALRASRIDPMVALRQD